MRTLRRVLFLLCGMGMALRVAFALGCWMKGGETVAATYVALIVAGRRDFSSVPTMLKVQVKADLEALELGNLCD